MRDSELLNNDGQNERPIINTRLTQEGRDRIAGRLSGPYGVLPLDLLPHSFEPPILGSSIEERDRSVADEPRWPDIPCHLLEDSDTSASGSRVPLSNPSGDPTSGLGESLSTEPAGTPAPEFLPEFKLDPDRKYTPEELTEEIVKQAGKEEAADSEKDRIILEAFSNRNMLNAFINSNLEVFEAELPEGRSMNNKEEKEFKMFIRDRVGDMIINSGILPDDPEAFNLNEVFGWDFTMGTLSGLVRNRLGWMKDHISPLPQNVEEWLQKVSVEASFSTIFNHDGIKLASVEEARKINPDLYKLPKVERDRIISGFEEPVLRESVEHVLEVYPDTFIKYEILKKESDGTWKSNRFSDKDTERLIEKIKQKLKDTNIDDLPDYLQENYKKWQEFLGEPIIVEPPSASDTARISASHVRRRQGKGSSPKEKEVTPEQSMITLRDILKDKLESEGVATLTDKELNQVIDNMKVLVIKGDREAPITKKLFEMIREKEEEKGLGIGVTLLKKLKQLDEKPKTSLNDSDRDEILNYMYIGELLGFDQLPKTKDLFDYLNNKYQKP